MQCMLLRMRFHHLIQIYKFLRMMFYHGGISSQFVSLLLIFCISLQKMFLLYLRRLFCITEKLNIYVFFAAPEYKQYFFKIKVVVFIQLANRFYLRSVVLFLWTLVWILLLISIHTNVLKKSAFSFANLKSSVFDNISVFGLFYL